MKNRFLIKIFAVVALAGCEKLPHVATYHLGSGAEFGIELEQSHALLAEYKRIAVFSKAGAVTRQAMFPDSGGYSATNLYRCGPDELMVSGYFDSWLINSATGLFREGRCNRPVYLGVFEGGGSKEWRFFPASECPEHLLKAAGG